MRALAARERLTPPPFAAAYGLHFNGIALLQAAVPVRWVSRVRVGSRGLCGAFCRTLYAARWCALCYNGGCSGRYGRSGIVGLRDERLSHRERFSVFAVTPQRALLLDQSR
jgi:hypothetical protein